MLDAPSALRLGTEERRGALTITLYGNKRPSNICSLHGSCFSSSLSHAGQIVTVNFRFSTRLEIPT